MVASVEAIFLSTFILISQNRMTRVAERRSELDLQISLLAEHEITELVKLTRAIAQNLQVKEASNPELSEITKKVAPEKVLERIEHAEAQLGDSRTPDNS